MKALVSTIDIRPQFSLRKNSSPKQSLIRCSCPIIDLVHLSSMSRFAHQLHHRLEEVDVETGKIIDPVEGFQCILRVVPVIANQPSNY